MAPPCKAQQISIVKTISRQTYILPLLPLPPPPLLPLLPKSVLILVVHALLRVTEILRELDLLFKRLKRTFFPPSCSKNTKKKSTPENVLKFPFFFFFLVFWFSGFNLTRFHKNKIKNKIPEGTIPYYLFILNNYNAFYFSLPLPFLSLSPLVCGIKKKKYGRRRRRRRYAWKTWINHKFVGHNNRQNGRLVFYKILLRLILNIS